MFLRDQSTSYRSTCSANPCHPLQWLQGLLGCFLVTVCMSWSGAVLSEVDCEKNLQNSVLLQSKAPEVNSVIERYRLMFETSNRDIYPGVRLRIKLAEAFNEIDRECLDRHIPLIFIDGFKLPQVSLRYLPSEQVEKQPIEVKKEAAGGTPLRLQGGNDQKPNVKPMQFDTLEFELRPDDQSKDIWLRLHNAPRPNRDVDVGIGFKVAADNIPADIELRRLRVGNSMQAGMAPNAGYTTAWIALFFSIAIGFITALVLWNKKPGVLRTEDGAMTQGTVQAFVWFVLISGMGIHLWVLTGSLPAISPTLLGLMGASGSTLVVAVLLNNKGSPTRKKPKPVTDVPSIQMWGFNVMVMLSFVIDSHQYLKLAAIEPTWAGVLGVSNIIYLMSAKEGEVL